MRSSGSSAPAGSGEISRRGIPKATRCTPGCWASRAGWPTPSARDGADPDYLEIARQELYRGQCNCPYWHGVVRRALSAASSERDLSQPDRRPQRPRRRRGPGPGPRVALEVGDFNLDARQEVRLENDRLIALVRPAQGGHIYELDVRQTAINVLATLDRRPEAYHEAIANAIHPENRDRAQGDAAGKHP